MKLRDAKFELRKGGVRLNNWLRWGSVRQQRTAAEGFTPHMRKHWTCPACKQEFVRTIVFFPPFSLLSFFYATFKRLTCLFCVLDDVISFSTNLLLITRTFFNLSFAAIWTERGGAARESVWRRRAAIGHTRRADPRQQAARRRGTRGRETRRRDAAGIYRAIISWKCLLVLFFLFMTFFWSEYSCRCANVK